MTVRAYTRRVILGLLAVPALAGLNVASVHLAAPDPFSPWNPAIGAGAALLLLGGPWMALAVVVGQLAAPFWMGWATPIGVGVEPALVSALTPVLLGTALRRFLDRDLRAWTVRQMLLLVVATLVAGVAVTLALVHWRMPGPASGPAHFRVGVGVAAGGVVGLSTVAVLAQLVRSSRSPAPELALYGRRAEFLGHMAFTLALGGAAYVLHGPTGERFWSLYFIPLLWTAFRFEMPEVVAGLMLMAGEGVVLAEVLHTPLTTFTNFHFFFFNFTATGFLLAAALGARRDAEHAKAEGDRRLRDEIAFRAQLLDNVGEAIVGTDAAGRVIYWNAEAERLFGTARAQALGSRVTDVVRYDLASAPELRPALLARQRWSGEVVVRRPEGGALHALATAVPLSDTDVRGGYVGVWRDITGKRELETQLAQAQKMDAIGRLAGGVAHDFNNLLTVVHFNVREAAPLAASSPELTALIEGILEAADRASALTRQLLAFTRAKQYQPKRFVVSKAVAGLERMLRRLLGERIDIVVTHETDARVRGDVGQLEQVLVNLAVNARDAMPHGGALRIRTDALRVAGADARRRQIPEGDYVRVRVSDEGVGMDAATLAKAFEPFFTTKPIGEGTGLGLSTAYALVHQAGGQIWAESAPGQGTTVSILLPQAEAADEDEAGTSPDAAVPVGRTGTILIVEDDGRVAAVAERALTRAGYRVVRAADGVEALRFLQESGEAVDLLLTDVVMPRMTGPELVTQARACRPHIPVVLMSGYTSDMLEPLAQPYAFLPKPFGPRDLVSAVEGFLARV